MLTSFVNFSCFNSRGSYGKTFCSTLLHLMVSGLLVPLLELCVRQASRRHVCSLKLVTPDMKRSVPLKLGFWPRDALIYLTLSYEAIQDVVKVSHTLGNSQTVQCDLALPRRMYDCLQVGSNGGLWSMHSLSMCMDFVHSFCKSGL